MTDSVDTYRQIHVDIDSNSHYLWKKNLNKIDLKENKIRSVVLYHAAAGNETFLDIYFYFVARTKVYVKIIIHVIPLCN